MPRNLKLKLKQFFDVKHLLALLGSKIALNAVTDDSCRHAPHYAAVLDSFRPECRVNEPRRCGHGGRGVSIHSGRIAYRKTADGLSLSIRPSRATDRDLDSVICLVHRIKKAINVAATIKALGGSGDQWDRRYVIAEQRAFGGADLSATSLFLLAALARWCRRPRRRRCLVSCAASCLFYLQSIDLCGAVYAYAIFFSLRAQPTHDIFILLSLQKELSLCLLHDSSGEEDRRPRKWFLIFVNKKKLQGARSELYCRIAYKF
ncbi:hypothetical protein EVAR_11727_1 [Eumeta japonica]|uniref:Uncharacterized protein n=1 Tax=Eumeta variegata TaxID=151549 RepID=A0A4C1UPA1_EUMVA|nr:hypothetical protein EVAR_11727_1 [Eumeta japonica]